MVIVLSKNGQALAPSRRYGKIRHLLRDGLAKVVCHEPFTVQLTYDTTEEITHNKGEEISA